MKKFVIDNIVEHLAHDKREFLKLALFKAGFNTLKVCGFGACVDIITQIVYSDPPTYKRCSVCSFIICKNHRKEKEWNMKKCKYCKKEACIKCSENLFKFDDVVCRICNKNAKVFDETLAKYFY